MLHLVLLKDSKGLLCLPHPNQICTEMCPRRLKVTLTVIEEIPLVNYKNVPFEMIKKDIHKLFSQIIRLSERRTTISLKF